MSNSEKSLVWSSERGDTCATCGLLQDDCRCIPAEAIAAGDGIVRVSRETKGRRGKAVTVVRGLELGAAELEDLARELKRLCGTGGTAKAGVVEIQGDQRDRVMAALTERGYRVKKAGG